MPLCLYTNTCTGKDRIGVLDRRQREKGEWETESWQGGERGGIVVEREKQGSGEREIEREIERFSSLETRAFVVSVCPQGRRSLELFSNNCVRVFIYL